MDVYLVPIGADRYELYCEVPDEPHEVDAEPPRGVAHKLKHRFNGMLAEAERERRQGADREQSPVGWFARAQARTMRWVAETIAEQRLLWHLRRQTLASFFYPDDLDEPKAAEILRKQLSRDFEKHRRWLIIDSLGFVASGLVMLLPGPNLVAYYFGFRLVGHYLSMRGARQGLSGIAWRNEPRAPLTALRTLVGLEPEIRDQQVHDVALELRLEHLATFFQRTAMG